MDRLKALLREPALLIDAFESVVVFAVAAGFLHLHGDQQTNLIGVFIALLAFVKGFTTQPFPVTVVTDLGRAALVFLVSANVLHYTPDQITIAVTMLGTVTTLIARAQITPRFDPVVRAGGAGAGPVAGHLDRNDVGASEPLYIAGVVLFILGLLDLVLLLFNSAVFPLVVAILLMVVGAICIFLARRNTL